MPTLLIWPLPYPSENGPNWTVDHALGTALTLVLSSQPNVDLQKKLAKAMLPPFPQVENSKGRSAIPSIPKIDPEDRVPDTPKSEKLVKLGKGVAASSLPGIPKAERIRVRPLFPSRSETGPIFTPRTPRSYMYSSLVQRLDTPPPIPDQYPRTMSISPRARMTLNSPEGSNIAPSDVTTQLGDYTHRSNVPGYDTHRSTGPGYDTHRSIVPGYDTHRSTGPGYDTHRSSGPGYDTHRSASEYGGDAERGVEKRNKQFADVFKDLFAGKGKGRGANGLPELPASEQLTQSSRRSISQIKVDHSLVASAQPQVVFAGRSVSPTGPMTPVSPSNRPLSPASPSSRPMTPMSPEKGRMTANLEEAPAFPPPASPVRPPRVPKLALSNLPQLPAVESADEPRKKKWWRFW